MRTYIGIDLGTTNSAICSFDGRETRTWKSPEQADVTPSAIYIDKRGHRFYGRKAFVMASTNEKNAAILFKRYMGTGKIFHLKDSGISMTPVECSAELLRVLYGYLPEEIRKDPETVTVITVPSAFNQMKKDATQEAAKLAGIGQVALMQEPVAAVMSVLKKENDEMLFIIYDLGGGTFDVSVARHIRGHVSLLAQGGREMCGGRDIDRWIYRHKILPWLKEHFSLPADPDNDPAFLEMKKKALFAAEEAKIALSASEEPAQIWVPEEELAVKDLEGKEIYLDLVLSREDLMDIMEEIADQTVTLTRETMDRAGVRSRQVDQIVFVGGPTVYGPLRNLVCEKLEIARGTVVNPMTAVAEGAAIYAETIDWTNDRHQRKESVGEIAGDTRLTIRYEKRCSLPEAKVAVIFPEGSEYDVRVRSEGEAEKNPDNSRRPGYDSGMVRIREKGILQIPLPEPGDFRFELAVYDKNSKEPIEKRSLILTRTLASVSSIPASHSVAIKALDRPGGSPVPVYLVRANDPLPKSGMVTLRAAEQLAGGSEGSLQFSLWEGEIPEPVDDNRYIGTYRIPGSVFSGGIIPIGAEVICDYEMNEAGNLRLGVFVPCVGIQMKDQNFYSRFEGQTDLENTSGLVEEVTGLLERTAQMKQKIVDDELDMVRIELMRIRSVFLHNSDQEAVAEAEGILMDCYRRVAALRQRYANLIRSRDLDQVTQRFERYRKKALPDEEAAFRNLEEMARYSIDMGSSDFESQLSEMNRIIGQILWRQDDVIRNNFLYRIEFPGDYNDRAAFDRLRAEGLTCLENKDMDGLRRIMDHLLDIRKERPVGDAERMFDQVGVYKG